MKTSGERILVRGVNWLGDAIMTTPALQRLREAKPDAHITLLTHAKLADLWTRHPAIDSVISFGDEDGVFGTARKIAAQQPAIALVLPNSPRSALEAFLARVPTRIGLARPWGNIFLTQRIPPRPNVVTMRKRTGSEVQSLIASAATPTAPAIPTSSHQLHHYLHLAAALGAKTDPLAPHLEVTAQEVDAIRRRLQPHGEPPARTPTFGLNAGAEYGPAKRWPRERFVAAAVELQRRTGCRWWIFGGKADESLAFGIAVEIAAAKCGPPEAVCSLAGRTSLRELCAALKACDLLLTNDTGPMHVAAAVGTPVIVPFGSTSPELTGPGLPGDPRHQLIKANVPCSPCFLRECPIDFRCMNGVSVDRVVEAALRVTREGSRHMAR
jgi:heptosyltransferase-2